jgi:hypothetical protein
VISEPGGRVDVSEVVGKILAFVFLAALVAVLVLWFVVPGGRDILTSPFGWTLIVAGPGVLCLFVIGCGVAAIVYGIEQDGIWQTLALAVGLAVGGIVVLGLSRALAPPGWVIVTFEFLAYALLAVGAFLVVCFPFGLGVALWRRRA